MYAADSFCLEFLSFDSLVDGDLLLLASIFSIISVTVLNVSCHLSGCHVSHLENVDTDELDRLLRLVVDVENLFMCVHKEEDSDTKQVYFFLFKVSIQHDHIHA